MPHVGGVSILDAPFHNETHLEEGDVKVRLAAVRAGQQRSRFAGK